MCVQLLFEVVHVLGHLVHHGDELLVLGLHVECDLLEIEQPFLAGGRVGRLAVELLAEDLKLLGQCLRLLFNLGDLMGSVVVLHGNPL